MRCFALYLIRKQTAVFRSKAKLCSMYSESCLMLKEKGSAKSESDLIILHSVLVLALALLLCQIILHQNGVHSFFKLARAAAALTGGCRDYHLSQSRSPDASFSMTATL